MEHFWRFWVGSTALALSIAGIAVESRGAAGQAGNAEKILADHIGFTTDISFDGRYALVNTRGFGLGTPQQPSELYVRDLASGSTTTIMRGRSPFGRPAGVFSADAKRVAFTWTEPSTADAPPAMLRTVLMAAEVSVPTAARVVVGADGNGVVPHGWSLDGRSILALKHGPGASPGDPTSIAWVSWPEGTLRTIKTLDPWRNGATLARPRLSPDGRWVAYAAISRQGAGDSRLYVVSADGADEREIAAVSGTNTTPVWTADSSKVVFLNVQGAKRRLMAVSIRPESAASDPVVLSDEFPGEPIRWTRTSRLFDQRTDNVAVQQILMESKPSGFAVTSVLYGAGGSLSSTGELAYLRPGPAGSDLRVRPFASPDERVYVHAGIAPVPPRWFNTTTVLVYIRPAGDMGRPGGGFYLVDLSTGEFTRVLSKDTSEHERSTATVLARDDRTLYLTARKDPQTPWSRIVAVDLQSGVERLLATFDAAGQSEGPGLSISPDGDTLAIYTGDGRVLTTPVTGGALRELHRPLKAGGGWAEGMRWTRDALLFVQPGAAADVPWRLMRLPKEGPAVSAGVDSANFAGASEIPRVERSNMISIDVTPEGSRIALSFRAMPFYDVRSTAIVVPTSVGR
jgi:Tol biopolymer transport system component